MTGHIQTVTRDTHNVVIDHGTAGGKRKRDTYTVRGTKRDAQKFLTARLAEADAGCYVSRSGLTVEAWLRQWLDGPAKMKVTPKTLQEYRGWAEGRIIPALGRYKLEALTGAIIQKAWADLMTCERKDGKRGNGLSPKTIRNCHGVLRSALETAVRHGHLARNPCLLADLPRAEKPEMALLDAEQITALLAAARGTSLYLPILLAATTGMRRGEILALRWSDVDLEGGTLSVARSLEQTRDALRFKEPKSGKPRRVVMPALLITELKRHREETGRVAGLVICKPDGSPYRPNTITHPFWVLRRKLGLPQGVTFHSLRHSVASLLLRDGTPILDVTGLLGHADPGFTLRVYGHLIPDRERGPADRMDGLLKDAARKEAI